MELAPYLHPAFLFTVAAALVGYVAWQIRIESKVAANAGAIGRLETELHELRSAFDKHQLNADIHFNLRISTQVEASNERRFTHIEQQLKQINDKLDRISEKK
ncbi:MAG: hypothetical protein KIS76_03910 [Pyrinomonadaceae bacterium]|nr:hypothetical protein [Pyrinomonadaceae bacterium]